jgi:putative addiction module component (TIGR02574 family)
MSKSEILEELPKLKADERREILERICEMEELALLNGSEPSAEEKVMLDRELEEYRKNPEAGSSWDEVVARLRKTSP